MNLLDVLEGNGWSIQQAIQTTFPFDPQFYSSYVRPRLRRRNCELPLVLIDGGRYERDIASSDWQEAPIGTDYLLEPVHSAGVFHPKISLFASERSVFYSISSANLTLEEYCKAAQIGYADGFQKNSITEGREQLTDSYFLARDVRDFYGSLANRDGLITGQDARNYITETAETLDWLDEASDKTSDGANRRTWFISNLAGPILSQALERLDQVVDADEISCVRLYAPYYGTPNVVRRLVTRIDADRIELLVEPDSTALKVTNLPDVLDDVKYEIKCMIPRRSSRWVHAKFIVFEGPWGSACLYGSPNMTSSALLEGVSGGNVEAGLFTVAPSNSATTLEDAVFGSSSYQFTVSEPVTDPEKLNLRSASYEGWESIEKSERDRILLEDARLTQPGSEGESDLILTISGIEGEHEFTVVADESDEKRVSNAITSEDNELSVQLSAPERELWARSVVTVEADGRKSNPRRVVEEMRAYYREYREITRSAGTQSSNTLLRAILQNPDTVAISVFDIALSELRRSVGGSEEKAREAENDSGESYPERSPVNLTSRSGPLPSLHSLVEQHLAYHRERAIAALDLADQPQPDDVQQFLQHGITFWETIELCFALDRLEQLDSDRVDNEKLFSKCESQLGEWFNSAGIIVQRLNSVIHQIENNATVRDAFLGDNDTVAFELDVWRSIAEVLFLHPGIVLEFDHESKYSAIPSKNGFASQLVTVFTNIDPHVGQHLLNGETLIEQVETLLNNLSVEIGTTEDEITLSGTGIQTLLLYILVQRTASSESFLDGLANHPRFGGDSVSNLATFLLQADESIVFYNLVNSLQWSITLKEPRTKVKRLLQRSE